MKPVLVYIHTAVFGACSHQVARMKAAQVFNPVFCGISNITSDDVDELARVYRFFSAAE